MTCKSNNSSTFLIRWPLFSAKRVYGALRIEADGGRYRYRIEVLEGTRPLSLRRGRWHREFATAVVSGLLDPYRGPEIRDQIRLNRVQQIPLIPAWSGRLEQSN